MIHKNTRVFQALCFFIVLLVISATGAFVAWSLKESRARQLDYAKQSIWAQIDIAQQSISSWLEYKTVVTARFADSRYFRQIIQPLLSVEPSWEVLSAHPLQGEIAEMFSLHVSQSTQESYQLITPNHRIIASSNRLLLGEVTEKLRKMPEQLKKIEQGNTVVFPLRRDVWKHHKDTSLEIAAPIFNQNMQLTAILLIEFNATQALSEFAHQANAASIGDICTVDMNGDFLNADRHDNVLNQKVEHSLWSQVQADKHNQDGYTLYRYLNYQQEITYALVYKHPLLPIYLIGKTTGAEALDHYVRQRNHLVLLAALVTGLCIISLILLIALNRRQLAKQYRENSELEQRVEERTNALKKQSEELASALDKAEAAIKTKTQFLANMSHEIRTPMNAIIGFTDILRQSDLNTEQSKQILIVSRAAHSLLGLLNDILDLSKMEAGRISLEVITFSIQEVVCDVINTLSVQADEKSIALEYSIDDACSPYLLGDPTKITQVLINIIGNAIKFTDQGTVNVSVFQENGWLKLVVKDTGIGISEARQKAIFQAFTQADSSITRSYGGTGLGTTISKQIVEQMGGNITLQSEEGIGSTFTIALNLPDGVPPELTTIEDTCNYYTHGLSILYAEDIEENIELIKVWLKPYEHQLQFARNGKEAVSLFKANTFDIVLMDIQMPILDGLSATKLIRDYEQSQQKAITPIIALSASALKEEVENSQQVGCNGFVPKPINISQLLATIESLLPAERAKPTLHKLLWEPTAQLPKISGIDIEAGINTWRSPEKYQECLLSFARNYAHLGKELQTLVKHKKLDALKALLHSLHGVSGNLKITSIYALTSELTELLHHSPTPFDSAHHEIKTTVSALATMLEVLSDSIQHTLVLSNTSDLPQKITESTQQAAQSLPTLSSAEHIIRLNDILVALSTDDIEQVETMIANYKSQLTNTSAITAIENALLQFDFELARTLTQQLIQQLQRVE